MSGWLDALKTAGAVGGTLIGIAGGAFGLGSIIGKAPVEAKLDAHLQPEVIHPEAAKRIEGMEHRIEMSEAAAREAAAESRATRDVVEDAFGVHRAGGRR